MTLLFSSLTYNTYEVLLFNYIQGCVVVVPFTYIQYVGSIAVHYLSSVAVQFTYTRLNCCCSAHAHIICVPSVFVQFTYI